MAVARCARSAAASVDVLSASGSRVFALSRTIRFRNECGIDDVRAAGDAIVSRIDKVCRRGDVDVVVPVDLESVLCLARVGPRITAVSFPTPSPDVFAMLHDKVTLARFLVEHDLPTPRTRTFEEFMERSDLVCPVIVKPRAAEGSAGVRRIDSIEQLHPLSRAATGSLLIQEFVDGEEIDLNVLADRGRIVAWTIQRGVSAGVLEFVHDEAVLEIGRRLVAASSFHGPANIDMRRSRDGVPLVIDVNPLLWDTVAASCWTGVNFPILGALQALGRPLPPVTAPAGVRYLTLRRAATTLLRDRRPRDLSAASWRGLREAVAEPLVTLYQMFATRSTPSR